MADYGSGVVDGVRGERDGKVVVVRKKTHKTLEDPKEHKSQITDLWISLRKRAR